MPIPGIQTIIRDRFYSVSRRDLPTGPKVLAIAKRTTADGTGNVADLDPVLVSNEADVITAFGEDSQCHRAYYELIHSGADRIYIVALPSDTIYNHTNATISSTSHTGQDIFSMAFEASALVYPDIIIPWGRGSHPYEWESPATPGNDPELGFHSDNQAVALQSWVYKIATKMHDINRDVYPSIAILGIAPYVGTAEVMTAANVSLHLGVANLVDRDDALVKEIGRHVVVVASEVQYISNPDDWGYANGATALAGLLVRTLSNQSPLNKPVFNIKKMRYSPTRTQQVTLGDKGVNSIGLNFDRVPVVTDGFTMAGATSDYTRVTTVRIINETALLIRRKCQQFIGEASTLQTRNAMETAVSSALRELQITGALLDSQFTITYVAAENKAIIDLVITPAFELRNIEVQIAVSLN